jgi:hypothetical protein
VVFLLSLILTFGQKNILNVHMKMKKK